MEFTINSAFEIAAQTAASIFAGVPEKIILLAVFLLICFAGYKLLRWTSALLGVVLGITVSACIIGLFGSSMNLAAAVIIMIVLGVAGGLLFFRYRSAGVFVLSAIYGALIVYIPALFAGPFTPAFWLIVAAGAVIFGITGVLFERPAAILGTSLFGFGAAGVLIALTKGVQSWLSVAVGCVLTAAGMAVQLFLEHRFPKTETMPEDGEGIAMQADDAVSDQTQVLNLSEMSDAQPDTIDSISRNVAARLGLAPTEQPQPAVTEEDHQKEENVETQQPEDPSSEESEMKEEPVSEKHDSSGESAWELIEQQEEFPIWNNPAEEPESGAAEPAEEIADEPEQKEEKPSQTTGRFSWLFGKASSADKEDLIGRLWASDQKKTSDAEQTDESEKNSAAQAEEPATEPEKAPAAQAEEPAAEPEKAPEAQAEEPAAEPEKTPEAQAEEPVTEPEKAPAAQAEEPAAEPEKTPEAQAEEPAAEPEKASEEQTEPEEAAAAAEESVSSALLDELNLAMHAARQTAEAERAREDRSNDDPVQALDRLIAERRAATTVKVQQPAPKTEMEAELARELEHVASVEPETPAAEAESDASNKPADAAAEPKEALSLERDTIQTTVDADREQEESPAAERAEEDFDDFAKQNKTPRSNRGGIIPAILLAAAALASAAMGIYYVEIALALCFVCYMLRYYRTAAFACAVLCVRRIVDTALLVMQRGDWRSIVMHAVSAVLFFLLTFAALRAHFRAKPDSDAESDNEME